MFNNLFRAEEGLESRSLENGNSKHLNPTGCRFKTVKYKKVKRALINMNDNVLLLQ